MTASFYNAYHVTGLNPVPWKATRYGAAAKVGKVGLAGDENLMVYKRALKEEIVLQNAHLVQVPKGVPVRVVIFIHRRLEVWDGGHNMWADATNLQKSTEDALNKILWTDDKNNRSVRTEVVEQDADVEPHILIVISPWDPAVVRSEEAKYPRPIYTRKSNINPEDMELF